MTHTENEIAGQPDLWRRAAGLASGLAGAAGSGVARALPRPGERVAVVGCGTSWFIGQSYAALREQAGHGETDAFAASEFPRGRSYDRVLALTRSGTTTEVLDLLAGISGRTPSVAITADPAAPVTRTADEVIVLDFADERSVVQTRFATTQLALLRAHLGEDLTGAIADAEQAVADPLGRELTGAGQFTFLGRGWAYGLAQEAALKLREAAGVWTEAYPAMEYRHGPITIAGPGRIAWLFGPASAGLPGDVARADGLLRRSAADPMAELIRVQRLAVALAAARGLDPDRPRHLTRSVIRTGGG
jgi:fructoselysine-6-P-deglycase FrlB-like protein